MMNFPDGHTVDVWEGERRLIAILKWLREQEADEDECLYRRAKALELMTKVTAALNRRWQSDEPLWAIVQVEMEHCLQIYREILDITARRIEGTYVASVKDSKDVGVQVGGSAILDEARFKDAATSMAEEPGENAVASAVISDEEMDRDVVIIEDQEEWPMDDGGVVIETANERSVDDRLARGHGSARNRVEGHRVQAYPDARRGRGQDAGCWVCGDQHAMHLCPRFMWLSRRNRYGMLRDRNFSGCHNCFEFGHYTGDCRRPDGCRCNTHMCQCGRGHRHNSTICGGKRRVY